MCSWSLIIGLVFIVVFSIAAWFLSPKGENQTYVASWNGNNAKSKQVTVSGDHL